MSQVIPRLAFACASPGRSRWQAPSSALALLQRYPHLSENELAELINLVQRMRPFEIALIMADSEMGPRLEAFCEEHQPWDGKRGLGNLILLSLAIIGWALLAWTGVAA